VQRTGSTGSELWRTDGTEAGTWLVKDIDPGFYGSGPGGFAEVDGMLFFTAYTGSQLWRSNGTEAGTQLVRSFSVATNLYGHQGTLYFSGDPDNTGQELWRSNGTFNTTERVKDLNGAIGASLPINFHGAGSLVYFDAATDAGWELWRSDGTEEGTWMVKDINPGGANGTLYGYADKLMAHLGDTLYFRADDGGERGAALAHQRHGSEHGARFRDPRIHHHLLPAPPCRGQGAGEQPGGRTLVGIRSRHGPNHGNRLPEPCLVRLANREIRLHRGGT
jgi:ELWxxDGT repeat protein